MMWWSRRRPRALCVLLALVAVTSSATAAGADGPTPDADDAALAVAGEPDEPAELGELAALAGELVEVGPAIELDEGPVGTVREVAGEGDAHVVLSSPGTGPLWRLTRTTPSGVTTTDLTGPAGLVLERDVATGSGGTMVGWVDAGVLRLEHVNTAGAVTAQIADVAGERAQVTEVDITPFFDRFLVTWVEIDVDDDRRMQVVSQTFGAGGAAGTRRPLSTITAGDAVGGLRAEWHAGRSEALVIWFEGPPDHEVPIRSRRVLSESALSTIQTRSDIGLPAYRPGDRWDIRLQLTVHGPTEWLIEARTYDCVLPCEAGASQLTFATHRVSFGVPFDGGFGNRPHWPNSVIVGSAGGPTLLIEQADFTRTGPAEVWELVWQTIEFQDRGTEVRLAPDASTFHAHRYASGYRLVSQASRQPGRATDLDASGFVPTITPDPVTPSPIVPTPLPGRAVAPANGYWLLDAAGQVYPFGAAADHGDVVRASDLGDADVVDLEPTPSGDGYWILLSDLRVLVFGDAVTLHDGGGLLRGEEATSMSAHPDGTGYWIFTDRGRALAFGTAEHHGDMGGVDLNGPVIGSVATPTGDGYYMVASDGGIFAFGDADFHGSMGGASLNLPVVGLAPTPSGQGYWLVAADGGIFAFGDADFYGSMGSTPLNEPVNGMVAYGGGYLMVASDGGIFVFGPAAFHGSLGSGPPSDPIVSAAALIG
ncbi:MAG: hypothetical protein AAFZ07_14150 [Actinomycetota bacterium]